MSLTYAQKRIIQESYPAKSPQEIATVLQIPVYKVHSHIRQSDSIIKKAQSNTVQELPISERYAYLMLLAVIVIIVYANGMFSAFVSDDIFVIVNEQERFRSLSYFLVQPTLLIRNIQYYLAYHIAGLSPFFFRLPNVLWHIGYVWIVYLTMPYFTKKKYMPLIVALFAAVHPMMIESVTWISGGIYAQAGFFTFLSFHTYLRARKNSSRKLLIYSLLLFIAALSSSEKTIIFPFIILLYEFTYGTLKTSWSRISGFFGISFVWGLMLIGQVNGRLEYLQLTNGTESKFQFNNPFIQVPIALSKYFELYLWPQQLTLYQSEVSMNMLQFVIRAIVTVVFFVIVGVAYKRSNMLFFWLSFFFISLLTTMNPFGLSWIVAERYSYLGSIGLYVGFTMLVYQLIDRKKYEKIGYTILIIIILALSVRTIVRNIDWQSEDNLWIATAKISQSDPKTFNNLGDVYSRKGDLDSAARAFEHAIELNPYYADATHNLANVYRAMGRDDEAFKLYERAVQLNPNLWQSHINLAALYFEKKEYEKALYHAELGYQINPQETQILNRIKLYYRDLQR